MASRDAPGRRRRSHRGGHDIGPAKHFLFLQGPHGPFVAELAAKLRASGARVTRVAFNGGDVREWPDPATLIRYRGTPETFAEWLHETISAHDVTDIILYGDHRWMHRIAAGVARLAGLRLHFLEEGYLRPHWVTYERDGVNGGSRLLEMPIERIVVAADHVSSRDRPAPDQWGAMGSHLWHGLRYHRATSRDTRNWPGPYPVRDTTLAAEKAHVTKALLDLPMRAFRRRLGDRRLHRSGAPYHVALLQLGHDASVQAHSPYPDMATFMADVAAGFASGAPAHHHLVFKLHPFEDGREGLPAVARRLEREHGLQGRVHVLEGERLATLLDGASSVVTVNSTAAQQALWRGLPVRAAGRAIYCKPGLVSPQPLDAFFARPQPPERRTYLAFRRVLLSTSQIKGGFYTASGRATLLRGLVDLILADADPYAALDRDMEATGAVILPFTTGGAG